MFILSILRNWQTRQVDYIQAFPQDKLEETIYMRIPTGFYYEDSDNTKNYVLLLKNNFYGLKQAAYNWNELLTKGLINIGFQQAKTDPCLFMKTNIICVIYVDDTIFFSPKNSIIDTHINHLKQNFELIDEGDVNEFLGIKIQKEKDGTIIMTQPGLIDQIIKHVGLEYDSKQHKTPATNPPLGKNEFCAD